MKFMVDKKCLRHACRKYLGTIAIFLLACVVIAQTNTSNPVIWADVPDPDVIRVGDTYYMSSTTMHMCPGVPIMKSKDLANWEIINYAYSTMADNDGFNLANGKNAYSGGSWASSISYNKGIYYVTTASFSTGRTYIYKTSDIEKGSWTTTVLNKVYYDQSLFFDDDGRVYIAYGHDDIWLTELTADVSAVRVGGINKIIIPKASSIAGPNIILTAEGTHFQKINGNYYMSLICWPSGKPRTQLLFRSASIDGLYEGKIVFQSNVGSAQGEYIDTPDGKWFAMFHRDNGAVGRTPDLIPVTWSDGWPVVGVNGQVPATLDIPRTIGMSKIVSSDEFDQAPPLKLTWQWNHNPKHTRWSLTQRNGHLRLTNERVDPNVLQTTNVLTQRSYGPQCSGYVSLDVSGMKDGDYAGLLAFQNKYGFVGVKMSGVNKSIVMATATADETLTEVATVPLNQSVIYLRIDMDFRNKTDKAHFFYSLNGTSWQSIGNVLQMNFDLKHFVGYRFGLFNYATKSSGGYADFDFFRIGATINEAQNVGPAVVFTSPANNTTFSAGSPVHFSVEAGSPNGGVNHVNFYTGSTLLGTDNSTPYNFSWTDPPVGIHQIKAVVYDNQGKTAEALLAIRVNVPQSPYGGVAHRIPGTIQFEEFDLGGNGFAYFDNTPGSEVSPVVNFRTDEDVDIETCTDAGGGYNIGYATAGEWLEYTVNVEASGTYDLDFRVAVSGTGRTLTLAMDGKNIASNVSIPNTNGWQTWQTVTVRNIELVAGNQVMRVTVGSVDFVNMNYVEFKAVDVSLPPVVSLTVPSNNASYGSNEIVRLTATASDPDGSVSKVDFYAGAQLIGSVTRSPYSVDWSRMNPGTYVLTAVATDDKGISTTSSPVSITIRAVQAPFNGVAHLIPGRIEAEEYDLGGEGLGYHEANTNGNQGGAPFRNDEVDIELTQDGEGVYNIAYILEGEWLAYTVEVMSSGVYDLNLRMAADGAGKTLHVEIDGVNVTGPVAVPNTGGWQTWETFTVSDVSLSAGEHVMRIVFGSSYMNLNYVEFVDVITGLQSAGYSKVEVYPNPFSGEGLLVTHEQDFSYTISDINGGVLESGQGIGMKTIGKLLDTGVFVLKIVNGDSIHVERIIKQSK